jgi:hypothetical protein
MRNATSLFALLVLTIFCACSTEQRVPNTQPPASSQSPSTSDSPSAGTSSQATAPTNGNLPVATAHGNSGSALPAQGPPQQGEATADTTAYDQKIKAAETKASRKGSSDSDKRALAAAYLERANFYYTAQQPQLYKFALGDFRRVLKYEPDNEEARAKMDQIIEIYHQLGKPVPTNGLEQ